VSELDPRPDPRPEPDPQPDPRPEPGTPPERRPLIERIGMAAIAAVLATMFGGVAVAAWAGGEPFLAVMGGIGSLMTAWVGGLTLFRG
jgi:hypothetical protein